MNADNPHTFRRCVIRMRGGGRGSRPIIPDENIRTSRAGCKFNAEIAKKRHMRTVYGIGVLLACNFAASAASLAIVDAHVYTSADAPPLARASVVVTDGRI